MAKKEKEQPATITFEGQEYIIDDMSDTQKELAAQVINNQNHVNDLKNKLGTNMFINEQLATSEKVFAERLEESRAQFRAVLSPENEEKAAA